MYQVICEVINQKGMHARAAAKIVALVDQFGGEVTLSHGDRSAPGNSLIKLLTLNAPIGSKIEISYANLAQQPLVDELVKLFAEGFGE